MILAPYQVHAESHFPSILFENKQDYQQRRPQLLIAARQFVDGQTQIIRQQHDKGASGTWVVDALTCMFDVLNQSLYQAASSDQDEVDLQDCSLIALGGYGRMEMNPRSDLDLMFFYDVSGNSDCFYN